MTRRPDRWLTTEEAASHLRISPSTLARLRSDAAAAGIVPVWLDVARPGAQRQALRWDAGRLDAWARAIAEHRAAVAREAEARARAARERRPRSTSTRAPGAAPDTLRSRLAGLNG